MALKKEIIFDNGVKINYHRIGDISMDNKNKVLKVSVVSYTDETYRQKEIENETNKNKYEKLLNLIFEENKKTVEERDTEQVVKWTNEANELVGKFREDINLSVGSTELEFQNVDDLSMSNIYNLIKQMELFKDAEDI